MTNSTILKPSIDSERVSAGIDENSHQHLDQRLLESVRLHYHSDHQTEYLRLQAQIESLLEQLQDTNPA
jgi:hypothetical protein